MIHPDDVVALHAAGIAIRGHAYNPAAMTQAHHARLGWDRDCAFGWPCAQTPRKAEVLAIRMTSARRPMASLPRSCNPVAAAGADVTVATPRGRSPQMSPGSSAADNRAAGT